MNDMMERVTCKYRFWEAEKPKAVVLLIHGMAEHMARYQNFAKFLNEHHYHVYGYDQRGHGETAGCVENLGYFGETGWQGVVEDVGTMIECIKEKHDLPVFLFGHSMGSFVSRDFSSRYSDHIDGLILSGTGYKSGVIGQVMIGVASVESKLLGPKHPSKFIAGMSNKVFNKAIKSCKTDFDWLSYNEENVAHYIDDPYCGTVFSSSFYKDLFKAVERVNHKDIAKDMKSNLPVFIFSGADDPVGDYGKGIEKVKKLYDHLPVKVKLYEGRHEMLHESSHLTVYQDVVAWLDEVMNGKVEDFSSRR